MKNEESLFEDLSLQVLGILDKWEGRMPDEIALLVKTKSNIDIKLFRKLLKKMQNQGLIMQTKKGKWAIPINIGYLAGTVDLSLIHI